MKPLLIKYHLTDVRMKSIPFIHTYILIHLYNCAKSTNPLPLADPAAPIISEIIPTSDTITIMWNYDKYDKCAFDVKVDGVSVEPITTDSTTKISTDDLTNCKKHNIQIMVSLQDNTESISSNGMPVRKRMYLRPSRHSVIYHLNSLTNCVYSTRRAWNNRRTWRDRQDLCRLELRGVWCVWCHRLSQWQRGNEESWRHHRNSARQILAL